MKSLIILLFSLLTISNIKGDYSIHPFLNYLQEKGIYDLLVEIKIYFGNDIAICFCNDLFHSKDCEEVINIYIASGARPNGPGENKTLKQIANPYKLKIRKATLLTDAEIDNIINHPKYI